MNYAYMNNLRLLVLGLLFFSCAVWYGCKGKPDTKQLAKKAFAEMVQLTQIEPSLLICHNLPVTAKNRPDQVGEIAQPNSYYRLSLVPVGAGQTITFRKNAVDELLLMACITSTREDPEKHGNLLLDFEILAADESLNVKDFSWNQKDFAVVARGADWCVALTSEAERKN